VAYTPAGQPGAVTFASGDTDGYQYDSGIGRLVNFWTNVGAGTPPQQLSEGLTWNANGSLQQLTLGDKCQVQTCSYAHDDLSRVASVACSGNTWSQNFSYDPFGNVNASGSGTWAATYDQTTNRIQTIPGASPSYDANGNLLNDSFHNYTSWDGNWGIPSTIDSVSLTYDALGRNLSTILRHLPA
jgi:hypothetical protein